MDAEVENLLHAVADELKRRAYPSEEYPTLLAELASLEAQLDAVRSSANK